jgi:ubiquitin-like protein Pup
MNIYRPPGLGLERDSLTRVPRAADQTQTTKKPEREAPKPRDGKEAKNISEKGKKLKEDMDKLVDEIDEVLEENAEEFVKNYIQRGGE